jgi:hypothetical protein
VKGVYQMLRKVCSSIISCSLNCFSIIWFGGYWQVSVAEFQVFYCTAHVCVCNAHFGSVSDGPFDAIQLQCPSFLLFSHGQNFSFIIILLHKNLCTCVPVQASCVCR